MKYDPTSSSLFSRRLKKAREQAGLTQAELGLRCGMDVQGSSVRINQYERGVHEPKFKLVVRIASILNVPTGYFYESNEILSELLLTLNSLGADELVAVKSILDELPKA